MGGKATHVDGGSVRASTVTFSAPACVSAAKPPQAQDRNATSVATRRLRESDTSVPIITQAGRAKESGRGGHTAAVGMIAYNPQSAGSSKGLAAQRRGLVRPGGIQARLAPRRLYHRDRSRPD